MHFIRLKARMLLAAVSCFTACCNNLYADSMAPQLTGFMRSSDAWGDNGQTTAYYGFYSISADGDVDFKAVSSRVPTMHGPTAGVFMLTEDIIATMWMAPV